MEFNFNLQKNLDMAAGNNIFLDVPKDGSIRVRLAHPAKANGELPWLVENHYRIKREDGEGNMAVACNNRHSEEPCFLCALAGYLSQSADESERAIGKGKNSIAAGKSYYLQVFPAVQGDDGELTYGDVRLLRLPKTGIDNLNELFQMQRDAGENFAMDPNAGRDVVIRRKDTGENFTKYSVMATGAESALADIKPDWEKTYMSDDGVMEKIGLNILTPDEQIAAAARSYKNLDWKAIQKALG